MSTLMSSTDAQPAPHHRRSREEVEALAKSFVAAPEEAPKSRIALFAAVGGGLIAVALIVAVALPGGQAAETTRATAAQSRAAAEAEAIRQRYEAERERKRKELAANSAYMEKMAAADAQILKDMSAQAEMLSRRAAAQPAAASDGEPTPREAPARTSPAPAATVASAPPKPAATTAASTAAPAQSQPAAAAPTQVAQVDKSQCSIHVSELSKSGKLTYADVAKMKGAKLDPDSGNVLTPPVQAGGRTVVFEVMPTGCVRLTRR